MAVNAGAAAAVAFDLDGTLLRSMSFHVAAWRQAFREQGLEVEEHLLYLLEGTPAAATVDQVAARHGKALPPEVRGAICRRKAEIYEETMAVEFYPGVRELLAELVHRRVPLALVTGSRQQALRPVLHRLPHGSFAAVVCGDDVARGKPDPEPYLTAARRLGLPPPRLLAVENAPLGIRAARRAGCRCVAVATTLGPEDLAEAAVVVRDHRELAELLRSWLEGGVSQVGASSSCRRG